MKLLICTDGSEPGQKAVVKGGLLAQGKNVSAVTVINVYEDKFDLASSYYAVKPGSSRDKHRLVRLKEEHLAIHNNILKEAADSLKEMGVNPSTHLVEGHPAQEIIEYAEKEQYDLIVIGSRGWGGLKKTLLGSVSSAVVQEAKNCIVAVVK